MDIFLCFRSHAKLHFRHFCHFCHRFIHFVIISSIFHPFFCRFVSAYDDDGETMRFRSHQEHWRARFGFRSCFANKTQNLSANKTQNLSANKTQNTNTNVNLHLTLAFQVTSESTYDTTRDRVKWTVYGVPSASRVSCEMSKGIMPHKEDDATKWVHSPDTAVLQIFASIHGHACVVFG